MERGWTPGQRMIPRFRAVNAYGTSAGVAAMGTQVTGNTPSANATSVNTWQPLGPSAVQTPGFGLVTGRVSAIALDPTDPTGNHLYLGTTGGGVWVAQNAAVTPTSSRSSLRRSPIQLAALDGAIRRFDQHRRADGAAGRNRRDSGRHRRPQRRARLLLWCRHSALDRRWQHLEPDPTTDDAEDGLARSNHFTGEGFAGFAWSTVNPQLVVAAVSQAYEGTLVNAGSRASVTRACTTRTDSGATWHLATITDGSGETCGAGGRVCAPRQCGDIGGVEPGAAGVCGGGALSRLLPVARTA